MSEALTQVAGHGYRGGHLFEGIEHLPVGAIANRMDGGLKASLRRRQGLGVDLVGRSRQQPGVRRLVGVGRKQRRPA